MQGEPKNGIERWAAAWIVPGGALAALKKKLEDD